jgi:deoxycytidylate deaminase
LNNYDVTANEAPELVVGLVTPIGVDGEEVSRLLTDVLASEVEYSSQQVHVIDYLKSEGKIQSRGPAGVAGMEALIDAGNDLRAQMRRKDAFALYAIRAIFERRAKVAKIDISAPDHEPWKHIPPNGRTAYIIRSIKRPEEIQLLRRVYGPWLLVVSAFATRKVRLHHLLDELVEKGQATAGDRETQYKIEELLDRDSREDDNASYGQDTRKAFSQADIFIDISGDAERQLRRFVRLVFSDRSPTPTPDEYAMFLARAAALRSSSPGRQVGAVIADSTGEIISAGSNEAPRPHGGYEWDNPGHDLRDIAQVEGDTFGEMLRKRELILDTLRRLSTQAVGNPQIITDEAKRLIDEGDIGFLERLRTQVLKESEIDNVIEYQRTVHAEMAAIQNAHRHGTRVDDCTMYTTSFPCHVCAKHILAAGIRRVVYIEPYPKSRAKGFYPEAVRVDGENAGADPVLVDPFIGVGPNLCQQLFTSIGEDRMRTDGSIQRWIRGIGNLPRLGPGNESRVNFESIRASEMAGLVELESCETPHGGSA